MKRKAATRRDSTVAKRNKTTKKEKSSSDAGKKRSKSKGSSSKQSIKRVREQRRLQQIKDAEEAAREEARRQALKGDLVHEGTIIAPAQDKVDDAAAIEDFFWEVESVVGRRIHRGRVEYLIRWKGCSEEDNTWEPTANLCDSAMEEAMKYTQALKRKEKQREEDEKKLFGSPDEAVGESNGGEVAIGVSMEDTENVIVIDDKPNSIDGAAEIVNPNVTDPGHESPVVDDHLWKWADSDQVLFREVDRIDVNDPNAAKIVTDARINGTPLVLVGHVGWANFTKRWLTKKKSAKGKNKSGESKGESNSKSDGGDAVPISIDLTDEEATEIGEVSTIEQGGEKENPSNATHEVIVTKEAKSPDSKMAKENLMAVNISDISAKSAPGENVSVQEPTQEDERKESSVFNKEEETKATSNDSAPNDLLDLSQQNYELDIKKMIKDIGEEDVPVIKRHYNEEKPIHGRIAAEKFLTNCWPSSGSERDPQQRDKTTKSQKNASNLYLHQWQFPLSDTAGRKLCHKNNALPKGIMGEDLLKYWLDLPQCKLDSPLQYIFMGREDTLSKLHRDPGGLEISIAPIVGEKECVLVHRSDGSNCLYHLTASLEDMDLQRFPLLSQARTWRSVIKPGEILLMPYGTYHQCRNVTPCLSYSRFHLDTVNLLPFVQSLFNGDAPEIDQEEVLWNLTSEIINRVDGVFDKVQSRVKAGLDEGDLISGDVVETVNTLRTLRHFVREVSRREQVRQVVKGQQDSEATKNAEHNFDLLVDDVDMCLHEFRYRQSTTIPPFKPRRGKALKNTLSKSSSRKNVIGRDLSKFGIGSKPVVAFNTSLENNYMSLFNADLEKHFPNASKDKVGESLIGELVPGDKISVKLEQKHVKAEVVEILPQMKSAYLSFEDYPSVYDEWQPYELVRLPTGAEIPPGEVKPGLIVIDLSNSNEYRAKIQSVVDGPMARVKLFVSQHEMTRLVTPAMILGRYVPLKRKSKKTSPKNASDALAPETEAVVPPIMRPTKAGQIVEVGSRGPARVTKLHGEPAATHVDVSFILGNVHSESMIPIEMVQLAPELDPESGRGRRQTSKKENEDENESSDASKKLADGVVSPSSTGSSD